jgi:glucose/arabinose dehydrogenase
MRNTHRRRALIAAAGTIAVTGAALVAGSPASSAGPSLTVSTYLTGLNAPRGITFDGKGRLYVAQSGTAGPGDFGLTHTGRVQRYDRPSTTPTWSRAFTSLYAHEAPPPAPADVLGPEGMSALTTGCGPHGTVHPVNCQPRLITSESNKGTGTTDPQIGRLFRINGKNGHATTLSDVGDQQWRWTKKHPNVSEPLPDSNPYAVLVARLGGRVRTFVADAGANTISEIRHNGSTRVIALIPNDTPEHDSTPTCLALGPDGMLYTGTLDLIVNGFGSDPGHSNVWRVDPNASYPTRPKVWATGLTTITACAFDRAGHFWAAEMFAPNPSGPPGDLVRIGFHRPAQQTHLGLGRIPLPGGIAVAPGGDLFVTVNSAAPGPAGQVVRVHVG